MTLLFRPQFGNVKWKLRQRRLGSPWGGNNNFRSREAWWPAAWSEHQRQFARRFGQLHYLACHAPVPVQKQWRSAYKMFVQRHFGSHLASMRYVNNWTCHSWL